MIDAIRQLATRLGSMVLPAIASRAIYDRDGMPVVDLDLGSHQETASPVLEPYGVATAAPAGAFGITLTLGGSPGSRIVISASVTTGRPSGMKSGEVALWSTARGGQVHVYGDRDGKTHIGTREGVTGIGRADRIEQAVDDVRDAIMNAKAGTGAPDSGAALLASMQALLRAKPRRPLGSEDARVS